MPRPALGDDRQLLSGAQARLSAACARKGMEPRQGIRARYARA